MRRPASWIPTFSFWMKIIILPIIWLYSYVISTSTNCFQFIQWMPRELTRFMTYWPRDLFYLLTHNPIYQHTKTTYNTMNASINLQNGRNIKNACIQIKIQSYICWAKDDMCHNVFSCQYLTTSNRLEGKIEFRQNVIFKKRSSLSYHN